MPAHKLSAEQAFARGAATRHPERYGLRPTANEQPELRPVVARDYAGIMQGYVLGVLCGDIPACRLVRAALHRHERDVARSLQPDYPYEFRQELADKVLRFVERMPHTKGKWAARKLRLVQEPWQVTWISILFGWVKRTTGKRRFRRGYMCVPRKNAKSVDAAAIGNYMLLDDGEFGAEVYSGATSEKQAHEVFGPARLMLAKLPDVRREYGCEVWSKSLVKTEDNSKFWPIIGKPGDGASPHCSIHDEYHEHPTSEQIDSMETGMGAREQPLSLVITTAGTDIASPCYDLQQDVEKVLRGEVEDDELFGIIYTIDLPVADGEAGDDWADPSVLAKANPNIGVSVDAEYLAARQRQALLNPRYQNTFKTKHLNVWCNSSVAGINMHQWRLATDASLSIDEFRGKEGRIALDLASKIDICANVQLFGRRLNDAQHWYVFGKYYLPEDTIFGEFESADRGNQGAYRKWVAQGHLTATDGAEISFADVRDDVLALKSHMQVAEIVYDAWRATQLAQELAAGGATCVEFPQAGHHMAAGYDELCAALASGRLHHDGNPVLEWMASNTRARSITKGLVVPSKDANKSHLKIDGIVALCMALSRAVVGAKEAEAQMIVI